jgi:hypothetical protein
MSSACYKVEIPPKYLGYLNGHRWDAPAVRKK